MDDRAEAYTRDADAAAIATMPAVVGVFRNSTSWYNNASFLLPLCAAIVVGIASGVTHNVGLAGFAAFLGVVTLVMLPLVLATWRQTATAAVLTRAGITTLHRGRLLKSLAWPDVESIRRRETQGNVRWEVATGGGERILLDGELNDLPSLLRLASELSGVPLQE